MHRDAGQQASSCCGGSYGCMTTRDDKRLSESQDSNALGEMSPENGRSSPTERAGLAIGYGTLDCRVLRYRFGASNENQGSAA